MKNANFQISRWTIGALALLAVASAVFYYFPQIDLFFAREMYLGDGKFLLSDSKLAAFFHGPLDMAIKGGFAVAFLVYLILCAIKFKIPRQVHEKLWVLFGTIIVAELVIINWLLKNHWGRPRPVQLAEFSGRAAGTAEHNAHFEPAWRMSHECISNCSFTSGHAANVACLALLALFLPPRWRPLGTVLAVIFVIVVGFMRMSRGAHFLSDVTISPLIVLATAMIIKDVLKIKA